MKSSIHFMMEPQEQSLWCWAATASSVSAYFADRFVAETEGRSWLQCEVANEILNCTEDCCNDGASSCCNVESYCDIALKVVGCFRDFRAEALTIEEILAELNSGNPVVARIKWTGTNAGHFVVIIECDSESREIVVFDPSHGRTGPMEIDDLTYGYNLDAVWTHTFLTHSPHERDIPASAWSPMFGRGRPIEPGGDGGGSSAGVAQQPSHGIIPTVTAKLPIYVIDLPAVLSNRVLKRARQVGWQAYSPEMPLAAVDFDMSMRKVTTWEGPFSAPYRRAFHLAGPLEPRLLRIPALGVSAIWTKTSHGDEITPVTKLSPLTLGTAYGENEFFAGLRPLARQRTAFAEGEDEHYAGLADPQIARRSQTVVGSTAGDDAYLPAAAVGSAKAPSRTVR